MNKQKKIYISGKITGVARCEYHRKFFDKAICLRNRGYITINPVALNEPLAMQGVEYDDLMHICYAYVDICDEIYMLEGWEDSPGARLEHHRAVNAGKKVIYESVERRNHAERTTA